MQLQNDLDNILKICYSIRDTVEKYLIMEYKIFPESSHIDTTSLGSIYGCSHPKFGLISLSIRKDVNGGFFFTSSVTGAISNNSVGGISSLEDITEESLLKYIIDNLDKRIGDS